MHTGRGDALIVIFTGLFKYVLCCTDRSRSLQMRETSNDLYFSHIFTAQISELHLPEVEADIACILLFVWSAFCWRLSADCWLFVIRLVNVKICYVFWTKRFMFSLLGLVYSRVVLPSVLAVSSGPVSRGINFVGLKLDLNLDLKTIGPTPSSLRSLPFPRPR